MIERVIQISTRSPSILHDKPEDVLKQIRRALKHKAVPAYLIGHSDWSVGKSDLVQECYCHLLDKVDGYNKDKAEFLDWCFWKSVHWFQSYFRQLTSRRELRARLASDTRKGSKGIVRYGNTWDLPPGGIVSTDDKDGELSYFDSDQDDIVYRRLGREIDPRPGTEWLIDLDDSISKLPSELRSVVQSLIDGLTTDQIAWDLDIHPTTVTARVKEAKAVLLELLSV